MWQYFDDLQLVALTGGGLVTCRTASCVIGTSVCIEQRADFRALGMLQARRSLELDSMGREWEKVNVVL